MYDAVVVLALKLNSKWELPKDLKKRLDYAADLYREKKTQRIIVSGKWSIWFDWLKITPPITEAKAMRLYLEAKGVPKSVISTESKSKDTIGNIYQLSKMLKERSNKNIAIICAEQHLARVKFLCEIFMDKRNKLSFLPIQAKHFEEDTTGDEASIFAEQRQIIRDIAQKLKTNPRYQLYKHPYYASQSKKIRTQI